MKKKAIIIGFGGMGQRYYKALKKIDVKVIGICDFKTEKIKKIIKDNFTHSQLLLNNKYNGN